MSVFAEMHVDVCIGAQAHSCACLGRDFSHRVKRVHIFGSVNLKTKPDTYGDLDKTS